MTDHPATPEPLDAQERELARILRALPAGEPSAAMDARILRAAGDAAAASQPRRRSRWLAPAGAMWGIGGAAAAVLALGVGLQSIIPEPRIAPREPVATAVSDRADDGALAVEFQERKPETFNTSPPPPAPAVAQTPKPASGNRERQDRADVAAAPPTPVAAPEAFAEQALDEHVAMAPAPAEESQSAGTLGAASAALEREAYSNAAKAARSQSDRQEAAAGMAAAKASDSAEVAVAAQATDSAATAAAAPAAAAPAAATPSAPMKPATWLAHVRRLRDANQPDAARASLQAFHKRYPNFVVPDDLAPLLRE